MPTNKKGIFEKLARGPVIGDGGFLYALERRGYVRAGPWTPECVIKHPEAVKQLHREFLRSGCDVVQAFTFFAAESKLEQAATKLGIKKEYSCEEINKTACVIAREVANEGDALVSASLTQSPTYKEGKGKECVQNEIRQQLAVFKHCDIDLIICEFFSSIEELEWVIETAKEANLPIASSMCIGVLGDDAGVTIGECAVRMVKAGAEIIGLNCQYDMSLTLEGIKLMKNALKEHNFNPYLMIQPQGFWTPELKNSKKRSLHLPESPFAMEARVVTRFEVAKWARDCYNEGIHYIGGCCGFEPYHIRAISEELEKERGKQCEVTREIGHTAEGLRGSSRDLQNKRATNQYWKDLVPCSGRPNTPMATLD